MLTQSHNKKTSWQTNYTTAVGEQMTGATQQSGGDGDGVKERFDNHTITKDDLTDPIVTDGFAALTVDQLFEYRGLVTDEDVKAHIITLIKARPSDPNNTYKNKAFTINSDDAVLRDDNLNAQTYVKGGTIPEGKKAGDNITIPNNTEVFISDYRYSGKKGYVYVRDYGWTAASNINGSFYNETMGITPVQWVSEAGDHKTVGAAAAKIRTKNGFIYQERAPQQVIANGTVVTILETSEDARYVRVADQENTEIGWTAASNLKGTGNQRTVNDPQALVRDKVPNYAEGTTNFKQGAYVITKETSTDTPTPGQYTKVYSTKKDGDSYVEDAELGWIASDDLVGGWADYKGPTAEWKDGKYIGQASIVKIIGTGGEPAYVGQSALASYQAMAAAAALEGITITVTSGFRTYEEQGDLYTAYQNDPVNYNPAFQAGYSPHQIGVAFDLNNRDNPPVNDWMEVHAWEYDLIKTYSATKERHHWEYRPEKIKQPITVTKGKKTYRRTYWGTWDSAYTDTEIPATAPQN